MTANTVHVRATRSAMRQAIARVPQVAQAGGATANAMMVRCGVALLRHVKKAFLAKARGGTDEAGDRWKPLSPATVAYSRRHSGLPNKDKRSATWDKDRPSWMLTAKQNKRWWELYRQGLAMFKGDKGGAARRAWVIIKGEGGESIIDKYGSTQVDILRDTGILLNSLSPGVASEHQVFRVGLGEVIVGTNRKHAVVHHHGSKNGRVPQRRLWPTVNRWPQSWWTNIVDQAKIGLVDIAMQLIRGTT